MSRRTIRTLVFIVIASLITIGCLARGGTMSNFDESEYDGAMQRFQGSTEAIDEGVQAFVAAYGDLTQADLRERMTALYAPELYFNDTIHTFNDREALVDYMSRTGDSLEQSSVDVKQVLRDGNDVFLRWSMEFRSSVAGKDIHSRSIGMTHLRFDGAGRVVLHQDFWDSGHALYAQLPVVGFFVRRAHNRM
ncbi:nuclear transport factor 2 family protein [Wenzhouxiangella marina]|uniref:SnoaL-like domain-containing protein n=1 Tax=Wenzhouxiangella marina TaxID=1579979 RepID=A0A0K0XXJ7_9GAMM|nr:nuclear transport factor 2 family protein [Wenzhouxiangella marina]AKS42424.1 hypothetical protein WM2015_2059 [Wenzhouxiangella marina]MBB6085802.1 hypothetical protein [Wenzhouxiangella marina]